MPTDPYNTPEYVSDTADVEKNRVFAILAYLWLLFLVPLLAAPNSRFARYHTNQGIVLFLASLVLFFAIRIVAMIPGLRVITGLADDAASLAVIACIIIGIINASQGRCKPLPLIGKFQVLK